MINPNDFVISRKRKKYKFAKFANAANCFEGEAWSKKSIDIVEVGAGTGLFSVDLATKYVDKSFVVVDVKADRLQKGAYMALDGGLKNVNFIRERADKLDNLAGLHSVEQLWLTFPDPYSKQRAAGRRLTHPHFLKVYQKLIRPRGGLYIKHDDIIFFHWSLEQLVREGWRVDEISFDLHGSQLSGDYKILTTYESRWLQDGRTVYFVKCIPPA